MIRIRKILDIRQGDIAKTLLMQFYLFLLILVLLILKPIANSLFLTHFGVENLPIAFIAIAAIAFIYTKAYNRWNNSFSFYGLHMSILIGCAFFLLTFGILGYLGWLTGFTLFVFYLFVALFGLAITSQFWLLSNIIFNAREARRLFSIIGAGGIAGGIAGGYLTSATVNILGNDGLLILGSIFLFCCIPMVRLVWRRIDDHTTTESLIIVKRKNSQQRFSFRRLYKSKHLMLLSLITGLGVLSSKLIDFQFQQYAINYFPDEESLTSFFGIWFSTFNLIGFLIQLLIANKLLRYLGVPKAQFILPIFMIIGSVLFLFFPILIFATGLKGIDGTLKQSIQRSINELLILPIPKEIKQQSKTFIDVFVDSLFTGFSGIVLILILQFKINNTALITSIIIVVTLLWLVASYFMRSTYLQSFKEVFLKKSTKNNTLLSPQKPFYSTVKETILDGNTKDLLNLLKKKEDWIDFLQWKDWIVLLNNENEKVIKEALRIKLRSQRRECIEKFWELTRSESMEIRILAYQQLLESSAFGNGAIMKNHLLKELSSNNFDLLIACSISFRDNHYWKTQLELKERVNDWIEMKQLNNDLHDKMLYHLLKAICLSRMVSLYHVLDKYFYHQEIKLRKMAIEVSGFTLSRKYFNRVLPLLKNRELRKSAKIALSYYGEVLLNDGHRVMYSNQFKDSTKILFLTQVSKINSQNAVNFLLSCLDHRKMKVRKQVLFLLSVLKQTSPYFDYRSSLIDKRFFKEIKQCKRSISEMRSLNNWKKVNMSTDNEIKHSNSPFRKLFESLELKLKKQIVTLFLLMGIRYAKQDILDIYKALYSKDAPKKSYALEFLEMKIEHKHSKALLPILEYQLNISSHSNVEGFKESTIPPRKLFNRFLKSKNQKLINSTLSLLDQEIYRVYRPIAYYKLKNNVAQSNKKTG